MIKTESTSCGTDLMIVVCGGFGKSFEAFARKSIVVHLVGNDQYMTTTNT